MDYLGTEDDDTIAGTKDDDFFDMSQGGNDIVFGDNGNDTFYFGAALTADDVIDGGRGKNTLILKGDYSSGLVFNDSTMTGIGTLKLLEGFSYNLTFANGSVSNKVLKIAADLGAGQTLTLDASDVQHAINVRSTAGHNNLIGGAGYDIFDLGKTFDAANEHIDGGAGGAAVVLKGDYGTFTFDAVTHANIANADFEFDGGIDYEVVVGAAYGAGESLGLRIGGGSGQIDVDASASAANITIESVDFQAFKNLHAVLGSGDDHVDLRSSSGTHTVDFSHGGNDTLVAHGDNTVAVTLGASFNAGDSIVRNDASSHVNVSLDGDYASGVVFNDHTVVGAVAFSLAAGHSYGFTTANTSDGMSIDGSTLGESDQLSFDGSAETQGSFHVTGGSGADTLIGGGGADALSGGRGIDILVGGAGADQLTGGGARDTIDLSGGGEDRIYYPEATDSSIAYDTVIGFNTRDDDFYVAHKVTGLDATVAHGQLDGDQGSSVFRNELQSAIDSAHLQARHAVLFTPDSGSLAGSVFLIVDQNGVAGFQASHDLVIKLEGTFALDLLDQSNFHTI